MTRPTTGPTNPAANGKPFARDGPSPPATPPPSFPLTAFSAFVAEDCRPQWLLPGLIVRGQPGAIAGPAKALKTNIAIDLCVSATAGAQPLGYFDPPAEKLRATLVSGESGKATIQETLGRVMKAKGVTVADIGDRLYLGFDLPQLTDLASVRAFAAAVANVGSDFAVIDPLYLALANIDPKNLFEMGRALMDAANLLLERGCTPIICHHANRTLQTGTPMELQHLAYSGLEQFARTVRPSGASSQPLQPSGKRSGSYSTLPATATSGSADRHRASSPPTTIRRG